jgi:hypothetical protein
MTGCQPRWRLRVDRSKGSCTSVTRGYGNCCANTCANGYMVILDLLYLNLEP